MQFDEAFSGFLKLFVLDLFNILFGILFIFLEALIAQTVQMRVVCLSPNMVILSLLVNAHK